MTTLLHCRWKVQVGGDGLFQEMLNGLLALRAKAVRAGEDGEATAAFASRLRLGHIPAGSTDAVAFSLNGTRSELSATLHIAIGDRSASTLPGRHQEGSISCPMRSNPF